MELSEIPVVESPPTSPLPKPQQPQVVPPAAQGVTAVQSPTQHRNNADAYVMLEDVLPRSSRTSEPSELEMPSIETRARPPSPTLVTGSPNVSPNSLKSGHVSELRQRSDSAASSNGGEIPEFRIMELENEILRMRRENFLMRMEMEKAHQSVSDTQRGTPAPRPDLGGAKSQAALFRAGSFSEFHSDPVKRSGSHASITSFVDTGIVENYFTRPHSYSTPDAPPTPVPELAEADKHGYDDDDDGGEKVRVSVFDLGGEAGDQTKPEDVEAEALYQVMEKSEDQRSKDAVLLSAVRNLKRLAQSSATKNVVDRVSVRSRTGSVVSIDGPNGEGEREAKIEGEESTSPRVSTSDAAGHFHLGTTMILLTFPDRIRKSMSKNIHILRAYLYVMDAKYGRAVDGDHESDVKKSLIKHRTRHLIHKFRSVAIFVSLFHLFLARWEAPYASMNEQEPYASRRATLLGIEGILILFHLVHLGIRLYVEDWRQMRKFTQRTEIIDSVVVVLYVVDWLTAVGGGNHIRFSRVVRPLTLFSHSSRLRLMGVLIMKTVGSVINVILLMIVLLLSFAILGVVMFSQAGYYGNDAGEMQVETFNGVGDAMLGLYLLFGGENYPDIMWPVLEISPWLSTYFGAFIILGSVIISSVFTADFYDAYKRHRKDQLIADRTKQRMALIAAFKHLDRRDTGFVDRKTFGVLMAYTNPKISSSDIDLRFNMLDTDGSGGLDILEFFELCDILVLHPGRSGITGPRWIRKLCRSKWFQFLRISIPVCHTIGAASYGYIDVDTRDEVFHVLTWLVLPWYSIEGLLNILARGLRRYLSRLVHKLEFTTLVLCLIGTCWDAIEHTHSLPPSEFKPYHVLMVMPVFRNVFAIASVERLVINLMTAMRPFLVVTFLLLALFYLFAMLGLELFGGNGERMAEYSNFGHVKHNFDSVSSAFLLLFSVFCGTNWGDPMYATVAVEQRWMAVWYYIVFHFFTLLIIRNVFVGMLLDALLYRRDVSAKLMNIMSKEVAAKRQRGGSGSDSDGAAITRGKSGSLDSESSRHKPSSREIRAVSQLSTHQSFVERQIYGGDVKHIEDNEATALSAAAGINVKLLVARKRRASRAGSIIANGSVDGGESQRGDSIGSSPPQTPTSPLASPVNNSDGESLSGGRPRKGSAGGTNPLLRTVVTSQLARRPSMDSIVENGAGSNTPSGSPEHQVQGAQQQAQRPGLDRRGSSFASTGSMSDFDESPRPSFGMADFVLQRWKAS